MRRPSALGRRGARWLSTFSLRARVLVIGIACVAGWAVLALGAQYVRTYTLGREAAGLEHHRRELLAENATLKAEIHRLRIDDQYIERLAREQLGMLRPSEVELVIVPSGIREPPGPSGDAAPREDRPSLSGTLQDLVTHVRGFLEHLLGKR